LLACRNKISRPLEGLKSFNFCFNILYLIVALWLSYTSRGFGALITLLIAISLTVFFWYIYPDAIAETIKHTRSKNRQIELFLRVQKHILIIITVIYTLASLIIWMIPVNKVKTVTVNEVINLAKKLNANKTPVLVSINSDWSYLKITNKSKLYQLEQQGMHVITFTHLGNSEVVNNWLKTYNQTTTPLNVLYTKRHPKGLVLPSNLTETNWNDATATFN
jgi:hypothetical protein